MYCESGQIRGASVAGARSGSVILMTVGLLVIIAMLGATFLIVSYLDALQSRALADKAPSDPVAGGILEQIRLRLRNDLHIDPNGPYGGCASGTSGWREFIDAPDANIDPWLSSNEARFYPKNAPPFSWQARLTNPCDSTFKGYDDVRIVSLERWRVKPATMGVVSDEVADTDGDGMPDAILFDTHVRNSAGEEYHAAARVTDLSGLICLNTAADANETTLPNPAAPVSVDLQQFMEIYAGDFALYPRIHDVRCGGDGNSTGEPDLTEFHDNAAAHLLDANSNYLPFAMGDEMYLRWLRPRATSEAGRLYEATSAGGNRLDANSSRLLTTFNCSRPLLRHPQGGGSSRRLPLTSSTALDDEDLRQELYKRLTHIIGGSLGRRKLAAHFVANLWAYLSVDPGNEPFKFQPVGEGFVVYGLVRQLVITEVYAASEPESSPGVGDHKAGYAVELMNPTDANVDVTDYQLQCNSSWNFDNILIGSRIILPGAKIVLYSLHGAGSSAADFDFQTTPPWYDVGSVLDLSGGNTAKIVRLVGAPTETIPLDSVTGADFDYNVADRQTELSQAANGRRDDDMTLQRATVAKMKYGSFIDGNHQLGTDNGVAPGDSDLADVWEGFPIITRGGPPDDIGELGEIYLVGPEQNGDSFPEALFNRKFYDDVSRGRADFRGLLTATSEYPDIPWATLLGEIFEVLTPDDRRVDVQANPIYGRVNINTATAEVLRRLPWCERVAGIDIENSPSTPDEDVVGAMTRFILAYRDREDVNIPLLNLSTGVSINNIYKDYNTRAVPVGAGINSLRDQPASDGDGFLTAGEIAIPLADFANVLLGWDDYTLQPDNPAVVPIVRDADYLDDRDSLYRAVSNLITVNSDVFAVNILVQLRDAEGGGVKYEWHYVAVLDRSNCHQPSDIPAVLLFSEVN